MHVEDFDASSLEASNNSSSNYQENLWICGVSSTSKRTDGMEWCRDVLDESYIPTPFLEKKMEPLEWPRCLATIDVSCLNHGVKIYDVDGYDIIPINMVKVMHEIEPKTKKN